MFDAEAFKENERLAWNACAERYDRGLTPHFGTFCQQLLTLAQLKRGQRILDVATGSGLAAFLSASSVGPEGRVIGTDLSDAMVALARRRASVEGLTNVEFLQMDAERLEFPSESFDAVICALGLMLFPAPDKALSEMYRVLRPGGVAALCVFGRGSNVALRALLEPFIPYMPPPSERGPSTFGFGRREVLEEALQKAGFSHIGVEHRPHVLSLDDVEDVWEIVLPLGRLAQIHSRLGGEAQRELKEGVLQIARDAFAGRRGGIELPFEITYAMARK